MAVLYTTVQKEAHCEQVIEKSRFIAHIYPVQSREEAESILGGLVRAYSSSARMALDAAGRHDVKIMMELDVSLPYSLLDRLTFMSSRLPFSISNTAYADRVTVTIVYGPEDEKEILKALSDLTGSAVAAENAREVLA